MPLRVGAFEFVPGPLPTLGAVALIVLTVSLGNWQAARAREKTALQALYEQRLREPAVPLGAQIFIDNQTRDGRAGVAVVTPLRLASGDLVLVDRGWIGRDAHYPAAPAVPVPAGHVEVPGVAVLPPRRYLELGSATVTGNVWQNLSIERIGATRREPVLPFVVAADTAPASLAVVRERPDTGVERHVEYKLTWYSLAVTTLITGYLAEPLIARLLEPAFAAMSLSKGVSGGLALGLSLLIATSVSMVFGELVAQYLAVARPLETSRVVA